ncbi:MAG: hypothetical protein ACLQGP_21685 [Isosphaeraceae bacterium]
MRWTWLDAEINEGQWGIRLPNRPQALKTGRGWMVRVCRPSQSEVGWGLS